MYNVNIVGREFNWTRKDSPQIRTVGYNGLKKIVNCQQKVAI